MRPTPRFDRQSGPTSTPTSEPSGTRRTRLRFLTSCLGPIGLIGLLVFGACAPQEEGGEAAAEARPGVTNQELGITLAQMPAGFEVVRNEGAELVLARSAADDPGRLELLMGPVQTAGVNLVERVWEEKDRIEAMEGGDYRGQNELAGAAIGTVYTSRGRFVGDDGKAVEELRALAVHPGQNRLLIFDYEYPPPTENTSSRLTELMQVIEQVEPADTPAQGGEEPEDATAPSS